MKLVRGEPLTLEEHFAWAHQRICVRVQPLSEQAYGYDDGSVLIMSHLVIIVCQASSENCYAQGLERTASSSTLGTNGFLPGSRLVAAGTLTQVCTPDRLKNELDLADLINWAREEYRYLKIRNG